LNPQEQEGGQQYEYINTPMGMPQQIRGDRADLLDKIKPELVVEMIRHKLLGEDLDRETNKWFKIQSLQERALTDIGAWEISNLISSVASINISISKLSDVEIKRRLLRISKTAMYMSVTNWEKYGIKNSSQLWFIHEVVFTNALAVLKQADEASIQELMKGTITENRLVQQEVRKDGMLSRARRVLGI